MKFLKNLVCLSLLVSPFFAEDSKVSKVEDKKTEEVKLDSFDSSENEDAGFESDDNTNGFSFAIGANYGFNNLSHDALASLAILYGFGQAGIGLIGSFGYSFMREINGELPYDDYKGGMTASVSALAYLQHGGENHSLFGVNFGALFQFGIQDVKAFQCLFVSLVSMFQIMQTFLYVTAEAGMNIYINSEDATPQRDLAPFVKAGLTVVI